VTSAVQSGASQILAGPAFTISFSSPGNFAAAPQVTGSSALATRPVATTSAANPKPSDSNSSGAGLAQPETTGQDPGPQRSSPQEEKTMITKGGAAAAITLSIIGMSHLYHDIQDYI
jgi:hypothetical protein